ncbi:amidohydrolase family protein [Phytoactinopolyspora halotolerans]|uniref:Amidohydrolase family protein n=1 Tax=Phytoactinopolyspora halotolerans TaxID=1981512 RepID=A0A6L9SAM4_9ACTN|nr:amidohydrolase family protein [Phytoactinopolyspora halotolerans]NEE02306.1 amidohydrolase family protein [Phytoactinopolyspora halotolerans]
MNSRAPAGAVLSREPWQGTPILDAHAHLGPYNRFFIADPSGAAMLRVMDRCGVSGAILSSMLGVELDADAGNEETAALCLAHPSRFAGYVVVNPWQDPAGQLERWRDHPAFVGVKLHPDLHEYPLDGRRYRPVWEYAEVTGRPVLTHTWAGSQFDDLDHLDRVATDHPRARILAGHAGVAPSSFGRAIDVARRHPRVVLELCGSHNHGRAIAEMVGAVGPGQVAFGSDFPFIDLRMSLGRMLFAELADEERAAVLGGTMASVLSAGHAGGTALLDRFRRGPAH